MFQEASCQSLALQLGPGFQGAQEMGRPSEKWSLVAAGHHASARRARGCKFSQPLAFICSFIHLTGVY